MDERFNNRADPLSHSDVYDGGEIVLMSSSFSRGVERKWRACLRPKRKSQSHKAWAMAGPATSHMTSARALEPKGG